MTKQEQRTPELRIARLIDEAKDLLPPVVFGDLLTLLLRAGVLQVGQRSSAGAGMLTDEQRHNVDVAMPTESTQSSTDGPSGAADELPAVRSIVLDFIRERGRVKLGETKAHVRVVRPDVGPNAGGAALTELYKEGKLNRDGKAKHFVYFVATAAPSPKPTVGRGPGRGATSTGPGRGISR